MKIVKITLLLLITCPLFMQAGGTTGGANPESIDGAGFCVVRDRVYLMGGDRIMFLDIQNGRLVSTISVPDLGPVGVVISAGNLITTKGGGYAAITAADPDTGTPKWHISQRSTSLKHKDGMLFTNDQIDDTVRAFSAASGKLLWESEPAAGVLARFTPVILGVDDRIFTAFNILSRRTGKVLKKWKDGRYICAGSSCPQGTWLGTTDGRLFQIDNKNTIVWEQKLREEGEISLIIAQERFLVFSLQAPAGKDRSVIKVLDIKTRENIWERQCPVFAGTEVEMDATGRLIVIVDRKDDNSTNTTALDWKTGKELWIFNRNSCKAFSPLVVQDNVLLMTKDGLLALDICTGKEKWFFEF